MKFLSACARLTAALFAILFIIAALLSLLLFNFERHFLDSDLYKRVLLEERVYDSLPRLLSTQIAAGMTHNPCDEDPSSCEGDGEAESEDDEGGPPEYFQNMDANQWELLLREILSANWLQEQTESVINQLFEFLESDETTPTISISLVDLKARLLGRNGVDTVLKIVDAQPPCSDDQLSELKDMIESDLSEADLLSCRPPQELLDRYILTIEETLNEVVGSLPDEANLGESFMESEGSEPQEDSTDEMQIGRTLRRIRYVMRWSPIVPIGLLLLVAVFGVRSFRDLLRWWGIPVMVTGLIALILSILSMPIFNWLLSTYVESRNPGYLSAEFVQLGFDLGRSAIRSYVKSITLQAGILSLVGLIFSAVSAFIKPKRPALIEQ